MTAEITALLRLVELRSQRLQAGAVSALDAMELDEQLAELQRLIQQARVLGRPSLKTGGV